MAEQWNNVKVVCSIIILTVVLTEASGEYGVVSTRTLYNQKDYCMVFYPEFASLPETTDNAIYKSVYYNNSLNTCDNFSVISQKEFHGNIVLAPLLNCSLVTQVQVIYNGGGAGLLIYGLPEMLADDESPSDFNIPVAQISNRTAKILQKEIPDNVKAYLYAPRSSSFDYSLFLIWIFAVFSVVVGSYWSGIVRSSIHSKEMRSQFPNTSENTQSNSQSSRTDGEESAINVSPLIIVVFVLCMGLMLVLLYFCFNYLVYIIIGLFVLASFISVYRCFEPLALKIPIGACALPKCNFLCFRGSCEVRQILLAAMAIALSLSWLFLRKESYSWILQDILGIAFCINMLQTIRLPNMQICTILLVLLFFYDIFFVFITPLLTAKGESVMVEVATGGNSGEQIPMVLRVPHLTFNALSVCHYLQYSLLGFGDILVPGLLVAYCHGFDLITKNRRVYFITTSIGYGIGLIITFIGLLLMSTPQPALLYLVPATLLPLIIAGLIRKELSQLWCGVKQNQNTTEIQNNNQIVADNGPVSNVAVPVSDSLSATDAAKPLPRNGSFVSESASEPGEDKLLLK